MLMAECAAGHVEVRIAQRVTTYGADQSASTPDKGSFTAGSLVLGPAGYRLKMGATDLPTILAKTLRPAGDETLPGVHSPRTRGARVADRDR